MCFVYHSGEQLGTTMRTPSARTKQQSKSATAATAAIQHAFNEFRHTQTVKFKTTNYRADRNAGPTHTHANTLAHTHTVTQLNSVHCTTTETIGIGAIARAEMVTAIGTGIAIELNALCTAQLHARCTGTRSASASCDILCWHYTVEHFVGANESTRSHMRKSVGRSADSFVDSAGETLYKCAHTHTQAHWQRWVQLIRTTHRYCSHATNGKRQVKTHGHSNANGQMGKNLKSMT